MKTRALTTLLALVAGMLTVTTAATVAPAAAEGCYPVNYGLKYRIPEWSKTPIVTHAWNKVLAPGGGWHEETTIQKQTVVTASVETNAEISGEASGVIAKASWKVGVTLRAEGSHTRLTSYTEGLDLQNTTSQNREYVVFRGVMKYRGRFKAIGCSYSTYQTYVADSGRWRSYHVTVDGTIRCDLTAPNAVARAAKRLYCG